MLFAAESIGELMSETAAALLILPILIALVIVLEGTRLCCTHLMNRRRVHKVSAVELQPSESSSGKQLQT